MAESAEEFAKVVAEIRAVRERNAEERAIAEQDYTLQELGYWVHLLATRSQHRSNPEKRAKDLYDAQNYLDMMQARLDGF